MESSVNCSCLMKHLLFYSIFLILNCACQKENVEIPDTGRKLVINGLITTDSLLNVRISNSYYIKDPKMGWSIFPVFDSVDVRFYRNNNFLDSLHYLVQDNRYDIYPTSNYKSDNIYPLPGNEYKIKVKRSGFPDATATTIIPGLVKIEKVDTSRTVVVPGYGRDFIMNCKIEFTDPSAEKNYYIINIVTKKSPLGKEYMAFDCNDPVIEEEFGSNTMAGKVLKYGYAFSDKLIEGKKYSLNVSFDGYYYWDSPYNPNPRTSYIYYFRLYSITEDYFKFIQTLNLFNATYLNPLDEPVMVYSNVSGGYGIFAGAAVSTDSIILHD